MIKQLWLIVNTSNIGYLIPEFPGQTHNFFWRERKALQELGIDTQLISTRRPPKGVVSASWARQAEAETSYLFPVSVTDLIRLLTTLLMAGPLAWYRCAIVIGTASGMSLGQKLRLAALIPFAAKLSMLARKQGWSHVHVHSCADAANIALFASKLSKCSYSLTLHGHLDGYGPNQAGKWSNSAFAILITNTLWKDVAYRLAGQLPVRLEIAPMGVDVEKFMRTSDYKPYFEGEELRIFSCGRLNRGKGYAFLIKAIAQLKQQGVMIKLAIAGEDEQGGTGYRTELERQIADEDLDGVVTLLGAVPEEAVKAQLEQAHLFLLASLDEALGVVLMEAMAMGTPVIATRVGGVCELVEDGVDGILIPPGDSEAIAEAILALAGNHTLAIHYSSASRQKIVSSFNHRRSAEALAGLLEKTLESTGNGSA